MVSAGTQALRAHLGSCVRQFRGLLPHLAGDRLKQRARMRPTLLPSATVVPSTRLWLEGDKSISKFRHHQYKYEDTSGVAIGDGEATRSLDELRRPVDGNAGATSNNTAERNMSGYQARRFERLVSRKTTCALECDADVRDIMNVLECPDAQQLHDMVTDASGAAIASQPAPRRVSRSMVSLEPLWEVRDGLCGLCSLSVCRDNLGVALQAERVRRKAVKMEQFLASRSRLGQPSTPSQLHGASASASLRIPSGGLNHGSVRGIRCMCFTRPILTCGDVCSGTHRTTRFPCPSLRSRSHANEATTPSSRLIQLVLLQVHAPRTIASMTTSLHHYKLLQTTRKPLRPCNT